MTRINRTLPAQKITGASYGYQNPWKKEVKTPRPAAMVEKTNQARAELKLKEKPRPEVVAKPDSGAVRTRVEPPRSPAQAPTHVTMKAPPELWLKTNIDIGKRGVFMIEGHLTPELAKLLMANNPDNRRPIRSTVAEVKHALKNEAYDGLNGETFKIAVNGELNDGQNRCLAVIESGISARVRFVFGLPRESRLTLDQGRARRAFDFVRMTGHAGNTTTTAVAQMLWLWEQTGTLRYQHTRLARSELAAFAIKHAKKITTSDDAVSKRGSKFLGGRALVVFLHCLLAEGTIDEQSVDDFVEKLVTGASLVDGEPIHIARQRVISGQFTNKMQKLELYIRAWNAHRKGHRQATFKLNDEIPEILP